MAEVQRNISISILCHGSRGDFQPYLALAVELKEAGYTCVRILTSRSYKKYTEEFQVEHVSIWDQNMENFMIEDPHMLESMSNGDFDKVVQAFSQQATVHAPSIAKNFVEEMTKNRPNLLIVGTFTYFFKYYAEYVLNIPTLEVHLQTFICSADRAPFGLPVLPNIGHFDSALKVFESYYDGLKAIDDALNSMSLPTLSSVFSKEDFMESSRAVLNGHPQQRTIICQPLLFKNSLALGSSEKLIFVGPVTLDMKKRKIETSLFGGVESEKKLQKFLDKDPENKPVYCGWGSMLCKSRIYMVELVVKSLQLSGERGVVLGGFAGLSLDALKGHNDEELMFYAERNILFLDKVSHESLFPLMKCIVHHGGSGTTNASLRSGVPTIITPVFSDQFDNAFVVNKIGNGIGFSKQLHQISSEELGSAIKRAATNSKMLCRAKEIQAEVLKENGEKVLLSLIKEKLEEYTKS